jgi:hypothetical protein
MGQCFRVGDVIDRDDIDVRVAHGCPENVAADSAESIDAYSNCHFDFTPRSIVGQPGAARTPTQKLKVYSGWLRRCI